MLDLRTDTTEPSDTDIQVPYRFDQSHSLQNIAAIAVGVPVAVAGRLRRRRDLGGLLFADLEDMTGIAQLVATGQPADALRARATGDWVGVHGETCTTRSGTHSIRVDRLEILAPVQRHFPAADERINDHDVRFRQRELDLWANPATRPLIVARSVITARLRSLLGERGFLEVETPILHHQAGGANARPFVTHHHVLGCDLDLRIAPELFLKRLVVGGLERVFEIGRNFRNEGISPRHNPEFTMLEAYQAYADYFDMMELTEHLVADCAVTLTGTTRVVVDGVEVDLEPPWPRLTMEEAVQRYTGHSIRADDPVGQSEAAAATLGVAVGRRWGSGRILAEVFDRLVDRRLHGPVFVTDYPAEVSPLAREHRINSSLTERFEVFVGGRELANAFSELTDPVVQRTRFEEQARRRVDGDSEAMAYDAPYVRALELGLPPTGGLGIGIDRLVMLLTGTANIREVIAFPTLAPETGSGITSR